MIVDWTVPFELTSTPYNSTNLLINQAITFTNGTGIFLLRTDGCSLTNVVRQTKDNVPQEDGAILHRRFTAGMEMTLTIQCWQTTSLIACDELLQEMVDDLSGYLYGLLNALDNEGRIQWNPTGGSSATSTARMLDDIRLLSYPEGSQATGSPFEVKVTVDCALPYAEDLTQLAPSVPGVVTNHGNRSTYPVWQIYGAGGGLNFTLTDSSTGMQFAFNDGLTGTHQVTGGNYIEIDTFRNSVTETVPGVPPTPLYNSASGVEPASSDFFLLAPGTNTITLIGSGIGGSSQVLVNAAWA